ncbi:unnamed protein product [Cuscuta campestris]|uniref:Uncharacterized protein n=1 Tax=Cuscuta campestris TaxID=132261 RepID=A0A484NNF7_9ASTE|nr:unnamed protein product [Cuscuta campestris]
MVDCIPLRLVGLDGSPARCIQQTSGGSTTTTEAAMPLIVPSGNFFILSPFLLFLHCCIGLLLRALKTQGVGSVGIGPLPRAALSSTTSTPSTVASPAAASIAVALSGGAALTVAAAVLEPAAMETTAFVAAVLGSPRCRRWTAADHHYPPLEESVKLEPLIVVFGERDDGAIDVALEIESANQEEEKATPLFIVRLRETEKNRNVEFDIRDLRESKMRGFRRSGVGGHLCPYAVYSMSLNSFLLCVIPYATWRPFVRARPLVSPFQNISSLSESVFGEFLRLCVLKELGVIQL